MWPDPTREEIEQHMWEQYWKENPDADPVKVMATIVVTVCIAGMLMCAALLVCALIAWFFGVV